MEIVPRLLLILVLDTLCVITGGHAAPLLDTKDTWNRNVFAPVVKAACSSDGQCWEWLPISEPYDETLIIPEKNNDMSRYYYSYAQFTFIISLRFSVLHCEQNVS